jgi:VanZ family protein
MARPLLPSDPRERLLDVGLWILTCACAGATLWFSFVSAPPGASLFHNADKVGHSLAYGSTLVCFMFAADWRPRRGDGPFPRSAVPVAISAIAVGVLIEWLQGRYFNRTPEFLDVMAEVVGSLAALGIFTLVRSKRRDRRPERTPASHEARA